jgi:hypothetical protein
VGDGRQVIIMNDDVIIRRYEFQEFEHVLTMNICDLKSNEDQRQNLKQYLVIGTGNMVGEDITCKGRVIIFEVLPPESQYYDPDKDEVSLFCIFSNLFFYRNQNQS